MRTGDAGHGRQHGFTYLALLFALALGGVALAAIGESWQLAAQREHEAELLFRGAEIQVALARYAAAATDGTPAQPQSLEQLLRDERQPTPRHWLRRLYADPFTGKADWRLLRNPDGGITGVASQSRRVALRRHELPVSVAEAASAPVRVGDWEFTARSDAVPAMTTTTTTGSTP